jgi:aldehyde:ferredoxin oxidoreductase
MTLLNVNGLGGLPTRNFRRGDFEGAEAIGADTLHDTLEKRGGTVSHGCMPGCVIRCSNKYVDERGEAVVGSLDYETVCLLGSNLAVDDLDAVAVMNRLCNDIGVDTMETGAALGVLAEAGVWSFGDAARAQTLIEEIGTGTPLGRLIASGCVACGRVYGVQRVPAVKGQGMAAYDPRAIKGMGLTYAVSPMGADHTAGNAIVLSVDHLDPSAQLEPVRELHLKTAVLDSLGLCIFTGRVSLDQTELVEQMCSAVLDWKVSFAELLRLAQGWLLAEREFNSLAGFTAAQDRLPPFMYTETLSPNDSTFDVPERDLERFYDF